MRYYRIAIVAHPTYEPADPVWSCYEELVMAGHAVEIIDPERFEGVLDASGAICEEKLSAFVRRFKPDCLTDGSEGAQALLARLAREGAVGQEMPARHFVVFGYVGPNNFGDELIFSVICDQLEARYPGCWVSLIGHNPAATLARQGVVSVLNEMKFEADVLLNGASALIFMAGIMFDGPFAGWTAGPIDPWLNPRSELGGQTAFVLMAAARGVPSVFLGIGAGPLANPDAQRLVRLQAANGARYVPRDAVTEELLLAAGVPASSIMRKADLAFLSDVEGARGAARARLAELGVEPGEYVAVALRDHESVDAAFPVCVAALLDHLWEAWGIRALMVDFAPEDAEIHARVREAMRYGSEARSFGLASDFAQTIDVLASARMTCAMRLHCSIVANACGVPSMGFDYNEKVGAFYELMGRGDCLCAMDAPAPALEAAADGLLGSYDAIRAEVEQRAGELTRLAGEAFDELERAVAAHPTSYEKRIHYIRRVSIEEEQLAGARWELGQARAELEGARAELAAAQRRIYELEHSNSFKVGSALMYVPGKLKRMAKRDA